MGNMSTDTLRFGTVGEVEKEKYQKVKRGKNYQGKAAMIEGENPVRRSSREIPCYTHNDAAMSKWLISHAKWQNYIDAYKELDYKASIGTSLLVTSLCTIGHVCSCSLIAYGLTRFEFRGRRLMFLGVILTILVPPQILQIPLYIQYAKMGWIGGILPMVIPSFFGGGLNVGLYVFIFMQFFKGIPKTYEEAAKLEGAGNIYIFLRIFMPVCSSYLFSLGICIRIQQQRAC